MECATLFVSFVTWMGNKTPTPGSGRPQRPSHDAAAPVSAFAADHRTRYCDCVVAVMPVSSAETLTTGSRSYGWPLASGRPSSSISRHADRGAPFGLE
jgi:hypothetical protein